MSRKLGIGDSDTADERSSANENASILLIASLGRYAEEYFLLYLPL